MLIYLKIVCLIVFSSFVLGIISNTIHVKYCEFKQRINFTLIKINVKKLKGNFKENLKVIFGFFKYLYKNLGSILIIDTKLKIKILLYIFSAIYIFCLSNVNIENIYFKIFSLVMIAIFLVGVGEFIHTTLYNSSLIINIGMYIIKYCIFLVYSMSLILVFFEVSNIKVLLLIIITLLTYSFLFLKNIIDTFESYLFQFINFIVVLIFINLFLIGLAFGMFYLEHNIIFNFFNNDEIEKINNSYTGVLILAIRGIEPFFNFNIDRSFNLDEIGFVPILENVLGNVYLLLIIGFFISYSTGVLIERKSRKRNENSHNKNLT